jgi:rsbT antagonist protein RsbS
VDDAFEQLYQAVSRKLVGSRRLALILDFSGVAILDLHEYSRVRELAQVAAFLGSEVCCVALNAGIAAFLAEADCSLSDLHFCMHLEDAFARVGHHAR